MLRPIIDEHAAPEGLEEIIVAKDKDVERVVRIYQELDVEELNNKLLWNGIREYYSRKKIPIITSAQIDLVLQRVIQETTTEQTNHYITGVYITHLIQESYTAGNNNFALNTKDTTIDDLAYRLAGTTENPITLTIQGNIGNDCGSYGEHQTITVQGNTGGWCGWGMKQSHVTINGNTGYNCGRNMKQSQLIINGNTGDWCGRGMEQSQLVINGNTGDWCGWRMEHSRLVINGNTGNDCGKHATDSTISTNNKETYKKIRQNILKGNKTFLYDNKGNIMEQHTCDQQ